MSRRRLLNALMRTAALAHETHGVRLLHAGRAGGIGAPAAACFLGVDSIGTPEPATVKAAHAHSYDQRFRGSSIDAPTDRMGSGRSKTKAVFPSGKAPWQASGPVSARLWLNKNVQRLRKPNAT